MTNALWELQVGYRAGCVFLSQTVGGLAGRSRASSIDERFIIRIQGGHLTSCRTQATTSTVREENDPHKRIDTSTSFATTPMADEEATIYRDDSEIRIHSHAHTDERTHLIHVRRSALKSDEDITQYRDKLERLPQGHPDRGDMLHQLALAIYDRFHETGKMSDLEEALKLNEEALSLRPEGHPYRPYSLGNIAICLHNRFMELGNPSDLNEAIALERQALELRPQEDPERAISLVNIAGSLYERFMKLGALSDLDEAIVLQRNALEFSPEGHPHRVLILINLANYHHERFKRLKTLADLDEAVALRRNICELLAPDDPDRAIMLGNLSGCLLDRFDQLGKFSDFDEVLALEHTALELRPEGHPDRAISLNKLANSQYRRFMKTSTISDLDEAIILGRNTLELRPQGHPNRADSLANLARFLHSRFLHLGTLSDLNEALSLEREALELRPDGHSDRALSIGNLACYIYQRFWKLNTLSDLDEALALQRQALELRPEGHPDRAMSLGNLASCLCDRFRQLGTISDLDEGLALERSALELRSERHPDRAVSLSNIAIYLAERFWVLEIISDLDEAITFERSALELRPRGHPERATSLKHLASSLHTRFKHSIAHDISDLNEAFGLYSQLTEISQTVSFTYLEFAKAWVDAAEEYKHSTTVLAYQTFLRLIVQYLAILPSLPEHLSLLKQLMPSLAVDAFSACIRYGNLANAVELLEQGRGVFWSQLTRLRSPLDDVIASGETGRELAAKFVELTSSLRSVLGSPPSPESKHDRALHYNIQLQDVIADIRKLPGLSRFLQPPHFSDLQVTATAGPVIIVNASEYSCDALVLLSDKDPIHVPLHITKVRVSQLSVELRWLTLRAKFENMTREFVVLLRELWEDVVYPIVKILQDTCPPRSRIWWCPTAEFSLLPLHAAGSYRKGQPNLTSLYISSYTPTLTALLRARQKRALNSSIERDQFLIVGQAQAPEQNALLSVNTELSGVSEHVGSVATVTCIQDHDANIAKVSEELNRNVFVHLACHGIPNREHPFESGFALGDGLLKVEHIMRYDLQNAQFAYLSACHTTVGDEESPDEVIHLAAAMQFAGFRSVIGTMWAVDDAHTREITSKFYEYMVDASGRLDHTRAAGALHRTMKSIRSSDLPFDQRILYIHIGA